MKQKSLKREIMSTRESTHPTESKTIVANSHLVFLNHNLLEIKWLKPQMAAKNYEYFQQNALLTSFAFEKHQKQTQSLATMSKHIIFKKYIPLAKVGQYLKRCIKASLEQGKPKLIVSLFKFKFSICSVGHLSKDDKSCSSNPTKQQNIMARLVLPPSSPQRNSKPKGVNKKVGKLSNIIPKAKSSLRLPLGESNGEGSKVKRKGLLKKKSNDSPIKIEQVSEQSKQKQKLSSKYKENVLLQQKATIPHNSSNNSRIDVCSPKAILSKKGSNILEKPKGKGSRKTGLQK